jgi:hypothetical protein
MFLLNDRPLQLDTPFTNAGIQYPANWLRLATPQERVAIGITEVADPIRHDDRFYWNGNITTPKALEDVDGAIGLKSQFIAQMKQTASQLLAETDWKVVRASEYGRPVDAETLAARKAIRDYCSMNIQAITNCSSVSQLEKQRYMWPDTTKP